MTISKYIVEFLKEYEDMTIDTNHIKDGSDQYGLFKSPSREKKEMIGGSDTITEHYQFLAKQPSTSNYDRTDSDEWMEELTYWVDDFKYNYDYPTLDNNRTVTDISLSGCPYPMDADDSEILYQISLSITYDREREV